MLRVMTLSSLNCNGTRAVIFKDKSNLIMTTLIREIRKEDNKAIAAIIKTVMPEFGASGDGFAIHDNEVQDMFSAYSRPRCKYFVFEFEGKIVGGGGVAPLDGGDPSTCELKKMYFTPIARGKGWGQLVLTKSLQAARELGFEYCYLETFNTMGGAMKLYEKNGFQPLGSPIGNTGHFSCDRFYKLKL
jgi:putative acetyltransferase